MRHRTAKAAPVIFVSILLLMAVGCREEKSMRGGSGVIPREDLPQDAAEWTSVSVSFPRLEPDDTSACPVGMDEIMEYVREESADTDKARQESLQFLRTARIGAARYWIWRYTESGGQECYLTVSEGPDVPRVMSLSDTNGLSPEQFMLADYYDEVYW